MNIQELTGKIQPCDMDRPFAFVSYCSEDSERVFRDVIHLQALGFNVWIDKNLKETDDSWTTGAFEAIEDINCRLFLFYISDASLMSEPCLKELRHRECKETRDIHGGESIPWISIEVASITDIESYRKQIYEALVSDLTIPRDKKNIMSSTLSKMMNEFFQNGEKIRIKSQEDTTKRYDYYQKIVDNLMECGIEKTTYDHMYIRAVQLLGKENNYKLALMILENCATNGTYLPAILLLTFIYKTGICGEVNLAKAEENLMWAGFQMDESNWLQQAETYKQSKRYEEAVAFYSAYAVSQESGEGFVGACRMWMKPKTASLTFAKKCAQEAARLGNEQGKKLFEGLMEMSESKFINFTKNVT